MSLARIPAGVRGENGEDLLIRGASWRTRDEAENAIFEYIDGWYNTRRIQKELGYQSPDEYETTWHT